MVCSQGTYLESVAVTRLLFSEIGRGTAQTQVMVARKDQYIVRTVVALGAKGGLAVVRVVVRIHVNFKLLSIQFTGVFDQ